MSLQDIVSDVLFGAKRGIFNEPPATGAPKSSPSFFDKISKGGPNGLLIPNVVISEGHDDQLVITDHPVELGAKITDHAFWQPSTVRLRYGWSPSAPALGGLLGSVVPLSSGVLSAANQLFGDGDDYLTGVYTKLRTLQRSRVPFQIITGKRIYDNMLLQQISFETDNKTEYSMIVQLTCREILIVSVRTATIASSDAQKMPQQTAPVQNTGTNSPTPATPAPPQSVLSKISDWFK